METKYKRLIVLAVVFAFVAVIMSLINMTNSSYALNSSTIYTRDELSEAVEELNSRGDYATLFFNNTTVISAGTNVVIPFDTCNNNNDLYECNNNKIIIK